MHTGLAAHDATVLWTDVAVLLVLARLLGAVARRLGQPPIVGSLVAGLLAGPSVFGSIWPSGFAWFRPDTATHASALGAVAQFSLLILLIVLGAETDLPLIRRLGRSAGSVVAGSLLIPLATAAVVALALPDEFGGKVHPVSFVLLVAAAMTVSSLPVIARIATEMGITRRNVGQLSIAAATVNDVVGFVVLALAAALVTGAGASALVVALGGFVALVVVLATAGQRGVDIALRHSRRAGPDVAAGFGVAAAITFASAAAAQALGVDAALGAFLAGVILGRSRFLPPRVLDTLQWTSTAVFAPLYFATAGLSVDIGSLGGASGAGWFVVVVVVAILGKLAGVYTSARLARLPRREATALGIALNGRGALQVILATAGLGAGILNATSFSTIILLSLVSSISVPPSLRAVLHGWEGTDDERQRLAHEREMTSNVVVRGQRLLLPTRGNVNSLAAARILDLAWPRESEVTLLQIGNMRDSVRIENVRATLAGRRTTEERAAGDDVVGAILAEANLGYGAICVGAAEQPHDHRLLPENVEELLNRSPIPLVIVRYGRQRAQDGLPVIRPRRILLAVTGNAASRAGQEVAQRITASTGADLSLLHVVTRPARVNAGPDWRQRAHASADAVLADARRQVVEKGFDADLVVRAAAFSGEEIHREADRTGADLVIAGTTVRRVGSRPFLGHTVEHLLEHVSEPTVVVVVLPDAQQAVAEEHIDRAAG